MNKTIIKPCPFCGETAHGFETSQGTKWGQLVCFGCSASGPEVRTGYDISVNAEWHQNAIDEWNRRSKEG